MSGLSVDPTVGLPTGNPVLGGVRDGVRLPYALKLGGATSAHLVLTFDGVTVADVPSGPASGTLTVAAGTTGLTLSDSVQVRLTALDPSGATIAQASTIGSVSDGATLAPLQAVCQTGGSLAPGDTLWVNEGETVRFRSTVQSGAAHVKVTAYDLRVDGTSILDDPSLAGTSSQWVSGTWTAPTGGSSQHVVTYTGAVDGSSRTTTQTFTMSVQVAGMVTLDSGPMNVDPSSDVTVTGTLKRSTDFAVVPSAPIEIWWLVHDTTTWTKVADTTTDAAGRFSATLTPSESGSYQVRTTGRTGMIGTTWSSTVAVGVAAHVVLSVDTRSTTAGSPLTFRLAAPASLAGVNGMLQLWNGQCWTTVAYQSLDPHGTVTLTYTPPITGTYRFGAMTGYSATFAPTASDDLTVVVR